MNNTSPEKTALQFNECINNRDLNGLALLMTDDHAFVDRAGTVHQPRNVMMENWRQFFAMFPNYKNTIDRVESSGNLVVLLGSAHWSEEQTCDPVIWTATIADELVREWRIYADTEENRKRFNLV